MIKIKRIYEEPDPHDGQRLLVDRLWPRGLSKEHAGVDQWFKEIAPSDELRQWFGHDPARWEEFRTRYLSELETNELLDELAGLVRNKTVTLLYAAKDQEHNNAVVLKEALEKRVSIVRCGG